MHEAAHTAVSMSACLPACPCLRVCVNVPVSLYVRLSACQVTAEGRWQLRQLAKRGKQMNVRDGEEARLLVELDLYSWLHSCANDLLSECASEK